MKKLTLLFITLLILNSCGIYKPSDARKVPVNANERVKKNMEEGKGFRISNLGKKGGDFLFSSYLLIKYETITTGVRKINNP